MLNALVVLESGGSIIDDVNPWAVGTGALVVLLLALVIVLVIGGGREHS